MSDYIIENITNFDLDGIPTARGKKTIATIRVKGNLQYVDISGRNSEEKAKKLSAWWQENCPPNAKFDVKKPTRGMLKRFSVEISD